MFHFEDYFRESFIHIHDRYQFEIKLDYPMRIGQKHTKYDIETYMFVPYNLNINQNTYPKNAFINDVHGYIRLKTPEASANDFLDPERSPVLKLRKAFDADPCRKTNKELLYELKMFCCIVKSTLRDHVEEMRTGGKDVLVENMEQFLGLIKKITGDFRAVLGMAKSMPAKGYDLMELTYADEYLSFIAEEYLYRYLEDTGSSKDTSLIEKRKKILEFIDEEMSYRKAQAYQSVPGSNEENEVLLFRKSVLKKYMANILFLNIRQDYVPKAYEEIFNALAAGIAMFFATLVAFYFQRLYGNFTMAFFIALIIGYMFKDRIKEFTRTFFSIKVLNRFYDTRFKIYDADRTNKIGICLQSFNYYPERKIDPQIIKARNKDRLTEISNENCGEKILCYKKRIKLFSRKMTLCGYKITGLSDIIRYNVSNLLKYMDDPDTQLFVTQDGSYHDVKGRRVYHVNMVIKFVSGSHATYKKIRLVLNRDGIQRIEPVEVGQ